MYRTPARGSSGTRAGSRLAQGRQDAQRWIIHPHGQLSITWFGHSTFLLRTPGGKRVLFDPWLTAIPACPDAMKKPPKADLILASHGHFDHIEDLVACARDSGAPVVGIFELCDWLGRKGIQNTSPMNKGGSQRSPACA